MDQRRVLAGVGSLLLSVGGLAGGAEQTQSRPHFVACPVTRAGAGVTLAGHLAGLEQGGGLLQIEVTGAAVGYCTGGGSGGMPSFFTTERVDLGAGLAMQAHKPTVRFRVTLTPQWLEECLGRREVVFTEMGVCETTLGICCPPGDNGFPTSGM